MDKATASVQPTRWFRSGEVNHGQTDRMLTGVSGALMFAVRRIREDIGVAKTDRLDRRGQDRTGNPRLRSPIRTIPTHYSIFDKSTLFNEFRYFSASSIYPDLASFCRGGPHKIPHSLRVTPRRNWRTNEGATGANTARQHSDDDEHLRLRYVGQQTIREQQDRSFGPYSVTPTEHPL